MKVTVRLHEGFIEGVAVLDAETKDVLFRLEYRAKHFHNQMVVLTPTGVQLYNLVRTELGKKATVREYVKVIQENLARHYGVVFQGLLWGRPDHTTVAGKQWFALSTQLLLTPDGELSTALAYALTHVGLDPLTVDLSPLLAFVRAFLPKGV